MRARGEIIPRRVGISDSSGPAACTSEAVAARSNTILRPLPTRERRHFPMRWLAYLVFITWSAALSAAEPVRSLREIRQENVVVQQWDTSCGAAALATLLIYQHGMQASEKTIAEAMLQRTDPLKVKVRGGFSLLDLKRYVDAQGLEGVGYMNLSLEDLLDMAPAIVPVEFRGYPHFVVVRGRTGEKVML